MNCDMFFWRDGPIDVENGLIDYCAKNTNGTIYIICFSEALAERNKCSWGTIENEKIKTINAWQMEEKELIRLIRENKEGVHFFTGMYGKKKKYLKYCTKMKRRVFIFLEIVSLNRGENKLQRFVFKKLYYFKYRMLALKYASKISGLLCFGNYAKKFYQKCWWKREKIFPFMYLSNAKTNDLIRSGEIRKFVYVGRFNESEKGVITLVESLKKINQKYSGKYFVDFVGGYGSDSEYVINECRKNPERMGFIGTWKSTELIDKLKQYDFCIVPSIYDGWNLSPQQAINAGIGCLASDNCGSTELITNSKAGLVFESRNISKLTEAIEKAIEMSNDEVEEIKNNSIRFQNRISEETVGKYFFDIIDYCISSKNNDKPKEPWK